jgi:hypothetical protein
MLWTTSARPSESVIYYHLLNGCPAIVVPIKTGAPLLAWDTLTLAELWKVSLPEEGNAEKGKEFEGIVGVLLEYLDLCVDWERMTRPMFATEPDRIKDQTVMQNREEQSGELQKALRLLVAGAVKSGESKAVKDKVDKDRAGIAMWRIP